MSCGVGRRHGSDLALLWLWCRPAATALIRPLAWEPPYALGAALEKAKRQKKKKKLTMLERHQENIFEKDEDIKKIYLWCWKVKLGRI